MNVLTSNLLASLKWVEHGFGTRDAQIDQAAMASLKQVHSDVSLVARGPGCIGEGDALITGEPGIAVSIRTADCFPILLADPRTNSVAGIHAGWRGTAAGIVAAALARMCNEFGTDSRDVYAAIGPGIGGCCYEVAEDVAHQFGLPRAGKLNLAVENRTQLIRAGIKPERIEQVGGCTFCNPAQFISWRRDHDRAGRMISFIRVAPR